MRPSHVPPRTPCCIRNTTLTNRSWGRSTWRLITDLISTEGFDETDEVTDDVEHGVRGDGRRCVGVAEAAEVRGDGVVAVGGEGHDLVPPWVPELREAVDEENHGAFSFLGDVHVDAVHSYRPVSDLFHLYFRVWALASFAFSCPRAVPYLCISVHACMPVVTGGVGRWDLRVVNAKSYWGRWAAYLLYVSFHLRILGLFCCTFTFLLWTETDQYLEGFLFLGLTACKYFKMNIFFFQYLPIECFDLELKSSLWFYDFDVYKFGRLIHIWAPLQGFLVTIFLWHIAFVSFDELNVHHDFRIIDLGSDSIWFEIKIRVSILILELYRFQFWFELPVPIRIIYFDWWKYK